MLINFSVPGDNMLYIIGVLLNLELKGFTVKKRRT